MRGDAVDDGIRFSETVAVRKLDHPSSRLGENDGMLVTGYASGKSPQPMEIVSAAVADF